MSSSYALVSAIVAQLKNSEEIRNYFGDDARIFDLPEKNADFPFVVVLDKRESFKTTYTECISTHALEISVYAKNQSSALLRYIANSIISNVSSETLNLIGHHIVNLAVEEISYTFDNKNITQTVTISYHIVTEAIE